MSAGFGSRQTDRLEVFGEENGFKPDDRLSLDAHAPDFDCEKSDPFRKRFEERPVPSAFDSLGDDDGTVLTFGVVFFLLASPVVERSESVVRI